MAEDARNTPVKFVRRLVIKLNARKMNLLVFCLAPFLTVTKALPVDVWSPLVFVTKGNHSGNAVELLDGSMYPSSRPSCVDPDWKEYCSGLLFLDIWLNDPPKQIYLYMTNLLGQVLFYVVLRNDIIGPTTTDIWFETATVVTSSYPEVGSSLNVQIDRSFMGLTAYREKWMVVNSMEKLNIEIIFSAFMYNSEWFNILPNHPGNKAVIISDGIDKCLPNISPETNISDTECSNVISFSSCFICCISRNLQYSLTKVGPGDEFLGLCRCYGDVSVSIELTLSSSSCKKYDDCLDHSNQYCVFFHHLSPLQDFLDSFFQLEENEFLGSSRFVFTEENHTLMVKYSIYSFNHMYHSGVSTGDLWAVELILHNSVITTTVFRLRVLTRSVKINYTGSIINEPVYIKHIDLVTSSPDNFNCSMKVIYTPFNHCGDLNPLIIYNMDGVGVRKDDSTVRVNVTGLDVFTFGCLNISTVSFTSNTWPSSVKLTTVKNHMYQAPTIRIQGTGGYLTPPDWIHFNFSTPSTLQPTTNQRTTTARVQTTDGPGTTSIETTSNETTTTTSTDTTASVTRTDNPDTTSTAPTSNETTTTTSTDTTASVTRTDNLDTTSTAPTSNKTTTTDTTASVTTTNNQDTTSTAPTSNKTTTTATTASVTTTNNPDTMSTAPTSADPEIKTTFKESITISELEDDLVKIDHLNHSYICKELKSYIMRSLTVEELLEELTRLQGNLTIDKQSLSATIRKKTSAVDNRPSAQSIGYVGVIILSTVFGLLILLDIRLFVLAFIKFKNAVIGLN
ncbi:hypothetical protein LOTGIDRAFT_166704 [Lottia gigantea]|uniref:Uncharacterized protein n=1 Tax=Lottia gigantea TaxID=225164 RepID=V4BDW7_LOTGI|nr:hypothetical protein LOTGIDRAFT_166704 [Lottia gigantea]ESO86969.1 hypothetical protein LOTGIDRAFT_166704 [Lottia gigantea]